MTVFCRHENGRLIVQGEQDGMRAVGGKKEVLTTNVTETYALSADGQALAVTETSTLGDLTRKRELFFRRRT